MANKTFLKSLQTSKDPDISITTAIGDDTAANVQAPAKGTGGGPTTATTVVKFLKITVAGTTYWVPLMQ